MAEVGETWAPWHIVTEHHGREGSIPTLYSGGPDLNAGPDTGYPDLSFNGFLQSLQANAGLVLKIRL
jgi:hypothetical protein